MNSIRSSSRAISFLMRTLILTSHASFAPFVLYERIIFSLSGHLYKISQQSHSYTRGICATFDDGSLCDILVAAWEKAILIHEKVGN